MIAYTVHEPPNPPADRIDRGEALVFVRDGFSLPAAIFPPLWLAGRQLWLPLAGYLVIATAIVGAGYLAGLAPAWIVLLIGAFDLFVGFEADALQRFSLEQRGFTTIGTVVGRNALDCERRFLDGWLPSQPMFKPLSPAPSPGTLAGMAGEEKTDINATREPSLSLWRRFLRGRAGG